MLRIFAPMSILQLKAQEDIDKFRIRLRNFCKLLYYYFKQLFIY